jgi:hypothetical protein
LIEAINNLNEIRGEHNTSRRYYVTKYCGQGPMRGRNFGEKAQGELSTETPEKANNSFPKEARLLRWDHDDIGPVLAEDPWEALAFPEQVNDLVAEFGHWLKSEDWYRSRQIPWRMGWLFHGKPGTGKTSLVRAIAQHFDLPVISFDLATFNNGDFVRKWQHLLTQTPCIALFEDFDNVFEKRVNKLGEEGGGLTFDCILNCISGIELADGVFTVITTNNLASIDEALGVPQEFVQGAVQNQSTRPGRMDRIIELPDLDEACRRKIAERILADCPHFIDETVAAGDGDTGAQFQDRCTKLALEHHWQEHRLNGKPNRIEWNPCIPLVK